MTTLLLLEQHCNILENPSFLHRPDSKRNIIYSDSLLNTLLECQFTLLLLFIVILWCVLHEPKCSQHVKIHPFQLELCHGRHRHYSSLTPLEKLLWRKRLSWKLRVRKTRIENLPVPPLKTEIWHETQKREVSLEFFNVYLLQSETSSIFTTSNRAS